MVYYGYSRYYISMPDDTNKIEVSLEAQPHGGSLRRKKNAIEKYGERLFGAFFEGFQKTELIKDQILLFKEYYYKKRSENVQLPIMEICRMYNEEMLYPEFKIFHPFPNTAMTWQKKWDYDIAQKIQKNLAVADSKNKAIEGLVTTRDEFNQLIIQPPADHSLESAVRTLAGELINDALSMLREDQALEEMYDPEVLVKRRNHIVNVLHKAGGFIHEKENLRIKSSEEKRNTAGFLLELLAKASAGTITKEEMALLKSSSVPTPQSHEPSN